MNTENKPRGRLLKQLLVFGALLIVVISGRLWWLSRPQPAKFVIAGEGGGAILIGDTNLPPGASGDASELPFALRFFSRLHKTRNAWLLVTAPGGAANETGLHLDIDRSPAISPAWAGGNELLYVTPPNHISLVNMKGELIADYNTREYEIKSLAVSRDGRMVAWSGIASRTPVPLNENAPASRATLLGSPRERHGYKLFVADSKLQRVSTADLKGIYPILTPGALEWGHDGALYFSGFVREDSSRRVTYRLDPAALQAEETGADWGLVFSISPDGARAASVGGQGLTMTETATGVSHIVPLGGPAQVTKPSWSRGGGKLAFLFNKRMQQNTTSGGGGANGHEGARIIIADASAEKILLTSQPMTDFECSVCKPLWTPNGGYILVNGYLQRSSGTGVKNRVVLALDTRTGAISYPENIAALWK